jgi:hypothetical protein
VESQTTPFIGAVLANFILFIAHARLDFFNASNPRHTSNGILQKGEQNSSDKRSAPL